MKLPDHTRQWWERVLAEGKLNGWLMRLHQAETEGSVRFRDLIARWKPSGKALAVLTRIADDELRHGDLVRDTLAERGLVAPDRHPPGTERYWDAVYEGVTDLATACAAATQGEVLALNRFRVLIDHPDTPQDVRSLASAIYPDEERHARDLRKLAGKRGMDRIRPFHRAGMAALGLAEVEDDA